jgi:hypothetical protein
MLPTLAFLLTIGSGAPQLPQKPTGPPPTPRHTGIKATLVNIVHDFGHLPSMQNLYIAGVGGGLALAAHPIDDDVNRHLVGNSAADNFFKPGKYIGQTPTLIGTSLVIYAYGRIKDEPRVSHLGMDLVRAMVVNETITQTLKYSVRRERPDLSDRHSFPSGHASTTFAIATALERHLGWKGAVPVYLFSSYVATSRLHDNRHYLSDVVFGATVGIISGRTVTRHGSSGYTTDIVPVHHGAEILITKHLRGDSY